MQLFIYLFIIFVFLCLSMGFFEETAPGAANLQNTCKYLGILTLWKGNHTVILSVHLLSDFKK